MRVIVSEHEITIIKDENINEKESNIQKIEFEFSNIYDGFSKYALITDLNNKTEKIVIKDNQIPMPYFEEEQRIIFGIYAEKIVDGKLYRLNPKPEHFDIDKGSLREAENHKEITPSEFEQYMQLLNDGLNNVDKKLTDSLNAIDEDFKEGINAIDDRLKTVEKSSKEVEQIGEKVSKQGLEAEKKGNYAEEKANEVINANNQTKEIIDEFESNVDKYTSNFNSNATKKETAYNNNHEVKLKEYNDNHKTKTDEFNSNASLKVEEFNINAVNKTNDFNNNMTTKTNEFNDNAINKKADFNNNVTEKTNIFDNNVVEKTNEFNENVDSIQKDITINSNKIQNVKDTVLEVSSAEGGHITINDGVNMQLAEFDLDGALKQASTKGSQLLKGTETFNTEFWGRPSNCVYTINDFLNFTTAHYDATNLEASYLDMTLYNKVDFLESKTDYILSFYAKGTSVTTYLYPLANENAISSQGSISTAKDGKMTFQLTNDWKKYYVKYSTVEEIEGTKSILFRVFQGDDATICGVMFEKSTEMHDWEPYTGEEPSPNPNYPQNIRVLEGNFDLIIESSNPDISNKTTITITEDEFVAKLSDNIKDELYTEYNDNDGKYHLMLDKKIGRIIVSENIELAGTASGANEKTKRYRTVDLISCNNFSDGVTTHITNNLKSSMYTHDEVAFNFESNRLTFRLPVSVGETLDKAKQWLKSQADNGIPFMAYYPLANSYTVDLGPIDMSKTYKGVNHIFSNSELQPKITINYYKNFKDTIKKLDNSDRELFEALPTSIVSGKNLYIKDAAKCKIANFKKEGFLKQKTTSGTNLYDFTFENKLTEGMNLEANSYQIKFNGHNNVGVSFSLKPITLSPGTYTYQQSYVSGEIETGGIYQVQLLDNNNTAITNSLRITENYKENYQKTFEISEKTTIHLRFWFAEGSPVTANNFILNANIISGATSTYKYEEFTGGNPSPNPNYPQNIELLNDDFDLTIESSNPEITNKATVSILESEFAAAFSNGVKDILRTEYNEVDGKYHLMLDKKIGKMILNGTETWRIASEGFWMSVSSTEFKNKSILKSDYYINYSSVPIFNQQNYAIGFLYNDVYQLYIRDKDVTTITEFKQKLSEHNVTVYYELANGYTVDLGLVEMPKIYKGVNHISTSDDESDIEVEYVLDAKLYIDNVLSELLNKDNITAAQNESEIEEKSEVETDDVN